MKKFKSLIAVFTLCMILVVNLFSTKAYGATYKYDSLGRLIEVVYESGQKITYTYDAAGNMLTSSSNAVYIRDLCLDEKEYNLLIGSTHTTIVKASLDTGKTSIITNSSIYSSSNPEIATISTDGTITGVKSGKTTITVKYGDKATSSIIRVFQSLKEITPVVSKITVSNQKAILTWDKLIDATGYKLKCGIAPGEYIETIDLGDVGSYAVENLKNGTTYYFSLIAYNPFGESIMSEEIKAVPSGSDILMIVGNSKSLGIGDSAILNQLESKGYKITLSDDNDVHPITAADYELVLISSSIDEKSIKDKYKTSNKPVLVLDENILKSMGMTGVFGLINYGSQASQTQLDITNTNHFITYGTKAVVAVTTAGNNFGWGVPGSEALVAATIKGKDSKAVIFTYNKGKKLKDGSVAVEKRTFLGFSDKAITKLNTTGWNFFDRAILWSLQDKEAPLEPQNLSVTEKTMTTIKLSWSGAIDNIGIGQYEIYRDGVKIATTVDTSYEDTKLIPGKTYIYYIKVYDISGTTSTQSESLEVTTESDKLPPSAPVLVTTLKIIKTVKLKWTESTDNYGIDRYEIYRDGVKIASTSTTNYSDNGLEVSTTYKYQIKAFDKLNNFAESNELTITTNQAKNILLIVSKSSSLGTGDKAIKDRLIATGYDVTVISDTDKHPVNLDKYDLVYISSTVSPTRISNKYKSAQKPIIIGETNILGKMGMTGSFPGIDFGTQGGQTYINFIDGTSPISTGQTGAVAVQSTKDTFGWAVPGRDVRIIGKVNGNSKRSTIFIYEAGKKLKDGTTAAGKRAFVWINNNTFSKANENGIDVFDRIILWAAF